jgi:hypothetical protein
MRWKLSTLDSSCRWTGGAPIVAPLPILVRPTNDVSDLRAGEPTEDIAKAATAAASGAGSGIESDIDA